MRAPPEREPSQSVPERFATASLRDYSPSQEIGFAASWLAHLQAGRTGLPGLHLYGPIGVGKSHLAAALANEIPGAQWFSMHRLFHSVRYSYLDQSHRRSPEEVARIMAGSPLIVLDDLGRPRLRTQWERDLTEMIVAELYDDRALVISTANLSIREMARQSSLPARALTCLTEMQSPLEIPGPSRRRPPAQNLAIR